MSRAKVHWRLRLFLRLVKALQKPLYISDLQEVKDKSNSTFAAYFYDCLKMKVARVEDFILSSDGHEFTVRLYHPSTEKQLPLVIYFHGGGFVLGGIRSYDHFCRRLSITCDVAVASVDYRLAPEHKFPAAHDDAWTTLQWAKREGSELRLDTDNITLMGDSAGGNLAASLAFQARDNGISIARQVLIYPVLDMTRKKQDPDADFLLSDKDLEWFTRHLVVEKNELANPRLSVSRQQALVNLPSTLIIQAAYDHLNDEIDEFVQRLTSANTEVRVIKSEGTFHGYITMRNWYPASVDPFLKLKEFILR